MDRSQPIDPMMMYSAHRFERKYAITDLSRYEVISLIHTHPAVFREVYPERRVNNVYLDTEDLANYLENQMGAARRRKLRVRWYGEMFGRLLAPNLEVKARDGNLGGKLVYPLLEFELSQNFTKAALSDLFQRSELPALLKDELHTLQPAILSRYTRRYFESYDHKYRITVDWNMESRRINLRSNTFRDKQIDRSSTIVELKYSQHDDVGAIEITRAFPFVISRNSKYVNGIEAIASGQGW